LQSVKVDSIFAGGFHSFVTLDHEVPKNNDNDISYEEYDDEIFEIDEEPEGIPSDLDEPPEGILPDLPEERELSSSTSSLITSGGSCASVCETMINEIQIVYTDTKFSHFFLRFTVEANKTLISKVDQLLQQKLSAWLKPTSTTSTSWHGHLPLKEFTVQIDKDIHHQASTKIISRGKSAQSQRQYFTVNLVCDVLRHLDILTDLNESDDPVDQNNEEVQAHIFDQCQADYGAESVTKLSIGARIRRKEVALVST